MKRLTSGASMAWKIAAAEAAGGKHAKIEPGHLFIGLLSLPKVIDDSDIADVDAIGIEVGILSPVLERVKLDPIKVRRRIRSFQGMGDTPSDGSPISRSAECKAVFKRAKDIAGVPASSLALMAALLENPDRAIQMALERSNVPPAQLREELQRINLKAIGEGDESRSTLEQFGRDLTRLAAEGKLGPVIGRRDELLQLLQTLARESKNNPVLVGEAGVGKTAIVEALAMRAAAGKDEAVLDGIRIWEINIGNLLAGTKYRGEFEKRLSSILARAKKDPKIVIFIDEVHTVMGAGRSGEQGLDAANMLKPALSRGELRCIGATTPDEYRRHIESDPAMERRFEKVLVGETTREETLEILQGLKPKWEVHHQVRFLDNALEAAVDLSLRYDTEHRLPDKAVDLADKAAARTRIPVLSMRASEQSGSSTSTSGAAVYGDVTEVAVAHVLAEKRGVPPERILEGLESAEGARLLELDKFLGARLIGQDRAIHRVAQRIRLAHSGIKTRRGPMAVFLFLGPTGVGKTEMARLLAEFLFGNASELVRFDMSEYMEEHSVSRLIGAPPGYVGHDEGGQLNSRLNRKPYSVVLLDEIEKAHSRIYDLFLQVFDEGHLTDSKGRRADARHAAFVLTSNLGTRTDKETPGFGGAADEAGSREEEAVLEQAQRWFRPELWNRIDEVIVFQPLEEAHALRILRQWIRAMCDKVHEQHGVRLTVTPEAEAFIARSGYSRTLGARELHRTLERMTHVPLSNLVLSNKLKSHPEWQLVYDEGGVYVLPRKAR